MGLDGFWTHTCVVVMTGFRPLGTHLYVACGALEDCGCSMIGISLLRLSEAVGKYIDNVEASDGATLEVILDLTLGR